jgi:hypothetical protein
LKACRLAIYRAFFKGISTNPGRLAFFGANSFRAAEQFSIG